MNKKARTSGKDAGSFGRHPLRKYICWTILSVFIFNTVFQDAALAFERPIDKRGYEKVSPRQESVAGLDIASFELPEELGTVKSRYESENAEGVIIHIRDAHGNYACQKKIAGIIGHVHEKYGISIVNLEGGKGKYDLELFNETENSEIRYKIADRFLREGFLNGAEFFNIISSGKTDLWGVEDKELYTRNLELFRSSLSARGEAMRKLAAIKRDLEHLKKSIFSEELFYIDQKIESFKEKNIEFEEYISFLLSEAEKEGIKEELFSNLHLLKKAYSFEREIDFSEANAQRDEFLKSLKKKLSVRQLSELIGKMQDLKKGGLSESEFYDHLVVQAGKRGVSMSDHPSLEQYIAYRNAHRKINASAVASEQRELERKLRMAKAKSPSEKELLLASLDLDLLERLLLARISPEEHEAYETRKNKLSARKFTQFINKKHELSKKVFPVAIDVSSVEESIATMALFYEYAKKRDEAFVENLRMESPGRDPGGNYGMLVTGGFHSGNLARVLEKRGFSYVSIMPEFSNEAGYENPYFDLLAGNKSGILSSLKASLSTIQLPSYWNGLGREIYAYDAELARAALVAAKQVEMQEGSFAIRATCPSGEEVGYMIFEKVPDSYRFMFLKDTDPELADVEPEVVYEVPSRKPVDLKNTDQLLSALREIAEGRAAKRSFTGGVLSETQRTSSAAGRRVVTFRFSRMRKNFFRVQELLREAATAGRDQYERGKSTEPRLPVKTRKDAQKSQKSFSQESVFINEGITESRELSLSADPQKAEEKLSELLEVFNRHKRTDTDVMKRGRNLIVAFCGLATDHINLYQNGEKAEEALQEAVNIFEENKEHEAAIFKQAEYIISIYKNLALFYKAEGKLEKAWEMLEVSKKTYDDHLARDPFGRVRLVGEYLMSAYISIAKEHRQRHNPHKAEAALEVALEIFNAQKTDEVTLKRAGKYLLSAYMNLAHYYFSSEKDPVNIKRNVKRARRIFEELKDEEPEVKRQAEFLITGYTKYINKGFRKRPDEEMFENMHEAYKNARELFDAYHETEPGIKEQASFVMISGNRLISYYMFAQDFERAESLILENLRTMDAAIFEADDVIDQAGHLFSRMVILLSKLAERTEPEHREKVKRILPEAEKFVRIYDYFLRRQDKKDLARLAKRIKRSDGASGGEGRRRTPGGMWGFLRPFYEQVSAKRGAVIGEVVMPVLIESVFFQGAFTLAAYLFLSEPVGGALISVAFWLAFHFSSLRRDSAPLQIAFFTIAALLGIQHLQEIASVSLALSVSAISLLHATGNYFFSLDGTSIRIFNRKAATEAQNPRISSDNLPAYADATGGEFSPQALRIKALIARVWEKIEAGEAHSAEEALNEARSIFEKRKRSNERVQKTAIRLLVAYHGLANEYIKMRNDLESAENILKEYRSLFEEAKENASHIIRQAEYLVSAHKNLALACRNNDDPLRGEEHLTEARKIFEAYKEADVKMAHQAEFLIKAYTSLAVCFRAQRNYDGSRRMLKSAFDLLKEQGENDEGVRKQAKFILKGYISQADKLTKIGGTLEESKEALDTAREILREYEENGKSVLSQAAPLMAVHTKYAVKMLQSDNGEKHEKASGALMQAEELFEKYKETEEDVLRNAELLIVANSGFIAHYLRKREYQQAERTVIKNMRILREAAQEQKDIIVQAKYVFEKMIRVLVKLEEETSPEEETRKKKLISCAEEIVEEFEPFLWAEDITVFDNLRKRLEEKREEKRSAPRSQEKTPIVPESFYEREEMQFGADYARRGKRKEKASKARYNIDERMQELRRAINEQDLRTIRQVLPFLEEKKKKAEKRGNPFKEEYVTLLEKAHKTLNPTGGEWPFLRAFYLRTEAKRGAFTGKVVAPVVSETVLPGAAFISGAVFFSLNAPLAAGVYLAVWLALHHGGLKKAEAPFEIASLSTLGILLSWSFPGGIILQAALSMISLTASHAYVNYSLLPGSFPQAAAVREIADSSMRAAFSKRSIPALAQSEVPGSSSAASEMTALLKKTKALVQDNRFHEAEETLASARNIFFARKNSDPGVVKKTEFLINAQILLAECYLFNEKPEKSQELLDAGYELFRMYNRKDKKVLFFASSFVKVYSHMTKKYRQTRLREKSEQSLETAIRIFNEHKERDKRLRDKVRLIIKTYIQQAFYYLEEEDVFAAKASLKEAVSLFESHKNSLNPVARQAEYIVSSHVRLALALLRSKISEKAEKVEEAFLVAQKTYEGYREKDENVRKQTVYLLIAANKIAINFLNKGMVEKAERRIRENIELLDRTANDSPGNLNQADSIFENILRVIQKMDKGRKETEPKIEELIAIAEEFLERYDRFIPQHLQRKFERFISERKEKKKKSFEWKEYAPFGEAHAEQESPEQRQLEPEKKPAASGTRSGVRVPSEEPSALKEQEEAHRVKKDEKKKAYNIDERMKELGRAIQDQDLRTIRQVLPFLEEKRKKAEKRGNPLKEDYIKLLGKAQKILNSPGGEWPFLSALYQRAEEGRGAFFGKVFIPVVLETILPGAAVIAGAAFFSLPAQLAAGIYLAIWLALHYGGLKEAEAPFEIASLSTLGLLLSGSFPGGIILQAALSMISLIAPHAYVNYRQMSGGSMTFSSKLSGWSSSAIGVFLISAFLIASAGLDLPVAEFLFSGEFTKWPFALAILGVLTGPGVLDDASLFGDLGNEEFIEQIKSTRSGMNAPQAEPERRKIAFPVDIRKEHTLLTGDSRSDIEFEAARRKKEIAITITGPSGRKDASRSESAFISNFRSAMLRFWEDFHLSDEVVGLKVEITSQVPPAPGAGAGYVPLSSYDPEEKTIKMHPAILKAPRGVLEIVLYNSLISRGKRGLSMRDFPHLAWQDTLEFLTEKPERNEEAGLFFQFLDGLDLIEPGNEAVRSLKGYEPVDYYEIDIDPLMNLDDKGRLFFPKEIKDIFAERGIKGLFVVRGDGPEDSLGLAHDIYSLGLLLRDTGRDPHKVIFEWVKLDGQGRINLSAYKKDILPDKRIMLVRMGPLLEIFTWENYNRMVDRFVKELRSEDSTGKKYGKDLLSGLLLLGGLSAMVIELCLGVPIFGEIFQAGEVTPRAALSAGVFFLVGVNLPRAEKTEQVPEERVHEEEQTLAPEKSPEEKSLPEESESAPEKSPEESVSSATGETFPVADREARALAEETISAWKETYPVDEHAFKRALFDYLNVRGNREDARLQKRDDPETMMAIRSATAIESMRHINPPHVNVVAQVAPIGSRAGAENATRAAATNFFSGYNGVSARSVIREGVNSARGYSLLIQDTLRAMEGKSPRALFLVPYMDEHVFTKAAEELGVLKRGEFPANIKVQYIDQGARPDLLNQFILGVNILDHFRKTEKDPLHRAELGFLRLVSVMVESLEAENGTKEDPEAILNNLFNGVLRIRKIDWESLVSRFRAWQAVARAL